MRHHTKDQIDDMVADATHACGEWCHHCDESVVPIEIVTPPSREGLMALRVACPRCGRSWGVGLGTDSFWREED